MPAVVPLQPERAQLSQPVVGSAPRRRQRVDQHDDIVRALLRPPIRGPARRIARRIARSAQRGLANRSLVSRRRRLLLLLLQAELRDGEGQLSVASPGLDQGDAPPEKACGRVGV